MTEIVANRGAFRPPWIYLGAIALGALLHWVWPIRLVLAPGGILGGSMVVAAAVVLFVYATRTLKAAGTPVPGNRPTTIIVRTGPYRWSRNPIYLSFSLLQLGIALLVGSWWILITLVPAVTLLSLVVIPREERYLEAKFPADYLPYKSAVRRWF